MALFLMTGRIGTILGTVIFPALINFGCLPPFIAISAVLSRELLYNYILYYSIINKIVTYLISNVFPYQSQNFGNSLI